MLTCKYLLHKSGHVLTCLNLPEQNAHSFLCIRKAYMVWSQFCTFELHWPPFCSGNITGSLQVTLFLLNSVRVTCCLCSDHVPGGYPSGFSSSVPSS